MVLIILVYLTGSLASAYTPVDGKVTVLPGLFSYKTNYNRIISAEESPTLTNFGLLIGGDINDFSSLEISIFHMYKYYYRRQENFELIEKSQIMHISMGYR